MQCNGRAEVGHSHLFQYRCKNRLLRNGSIIAALMVDGLGLQAAIDNRESV
jgi:hypothetical protein